MHKYYNIYGIDMPTLVKDIVANENVSVKVEELDGFHRVSSQKTFEDVMKFAENSSNAHWVFIHRKHFDMGFGEPNKLETGVSVENEGKSYFIFVYGEEKLVKKYTEKYKIVTTL